MVYLGPTGKIDPEIEKIKRKEMIYKVFRSEKNLIINHSLGWIGFFLTQLYVLTIIECDFVSYIFMFLFLSSSTIMTYIILIKVFNNRKNKARNEGAICLYCTNKCLDFKYQKCFLCPLFNKNRRIRWIQNLMKF